jgi:hypothetical protein
MLIPEKHYRYAAPDQSLEIVHPYLMMEWLRLGVLSKKI